MVSKKVSQYTIENLPLNFLKCRAFGHAWEEFIPVGKKRPSFGFRVSLLCTSCGMERHDILDTNGFLATRDYDEPDGYFNVGKHSRAEYRVRYNKKRVKKRLGSQRGLRAV